ncbi:uncharacterized protein LOC125007019 isoform X2 [Mugil cephalus]|uniref:uncharacterized protein LOC125007019 isoform X2 n=1 Tax=Mugil cephalus TaxID=48193 RepID=UPI001FB5CBE4|nr:uncharacterized protein LOC125007019 isoform X2 [Mugil cephalus]
MKKLCVIVVVLSLVSVCRPVPLTCEKLMKPVDQDPDLTGRWYYIAGSSKVCWAIVLFNTFLWPSIAVDITSTETPDVYNYNDQLKIYGHCLNNSHLNFYKNHSIFSVDGYYAEVLLHTSCPDCIVLNAHDYTLGRRKAITEAELKEFEMQTECFGWSKPQVLNNEFDYQNCNTLDVNPTEWSLALKIFERAYTMRHSIASCIIDTFLPSSFQLYNRHK